MAIRQLTPLRMVAPAPKAEGRATVEIYRPFFLAGIFSVLTAGCTLGAIALLGIALKGSYTASTWTPYVLAHANSQLYGWVGFFVMGFALQQHAPRQSKAVLFHRLAYWSLGLMALGIGLRFAAEPLANVDRSVWIPVGVFSCLLQVAAVVLFNVNTAVTRFKTGEPMTWQTKFVFASLFWWLVVVIAEPFFFAYSHQPGFAGISFVAQYFAPYREAQFLGFVSMMIFGVALVKMNSCFGAKPAMRFHGELGFIIWNVGLLARMVGWVMFFRAGLEPGQSMIYSLGGTLIATGAMLLVLSSRLLERLSTSLPSHKFIRGAMVWLLIGGALTLLEPIHLRILGAPFSHSYTGAIRHALTVGFISQMILGVGMHVIARMNDIPESSQRSLWAVFWLLNIGNAFRVGFEIATDYLPAAFLPMGATGFVELTGLTIWAAYVARPMLARRTLSVV